MYQGLLPLSKNPSTFCRYDKSKFLSTFLKYEKNLCTAQIVKLLILKTGNVWKPFILILRSLFLEAAPLHAPKNVFSVYKLYELIYVASFNVLSIFGITVVAIISSEPYTTTTKTIELHQLFCVGINDVCICCWRSNSSLIKIIKRYLLASLYLYGADPKKINSGWKELTFIVVLSNTHDRITKLLRNHRLVC